MIFKKIMRLKNFYLFSVVFLLFSCGVQQTDETEKKINELLSKMTLQEKIGQMNQLGGAGLSDDMLHSVRTGMVGSILNEPSPEYMNELQRIAVEESRLGIPIVFARDVIHGFKTIFPIPLGQAASWNLQLVEDGARVASIEATATGIRWTFAPMIDVSRDPRWGRIAESCGEDPYLTSVMGVAMIKGFQGDDLSDVTSMAACAKHFAAYGAAEAGKDYNTTWIPESQLRETYLPPFKAAVDAGVASFMCAFNDINGVPASGNNFLNKTILREEWSYDGLLVSDWKSIEQMIPHGFVRDLKGAAKAAANSTVDMDMMGHAYTGFLEELVKEGMVKTQTIDNAVRNILRMKFRLGLFDNPYTVIPDEMPFYSEDALEKAKQAAIEGTVLLKNANDILPLRSDVKSVAVVGPLADAPFDQLGTWSLDAEPEHSVTPLMAIRETFGKTVKINAEAGLTYSRDKSSAGIQKAVEAAKKSDVVLFFAGEESILSGEARCRADISLPGAQSEMLTALKKTGKPIVLIVIAGRPLTIWKESEEADAILYAFHGGTMAGQALADLIFGEAVPSGKLPVTIPKMVGQVPIYYAHKNTGRPAAVDIQLIDDIPISAKQRSLGFTSYFLDAGDSPLFPFGYGLSYTTFEYSDVKLSTNTLTKGQTLKVECTITNTGKYDGAEVVQLYIRDNVAELIRPVRELKGFQKISLKAGKSQTVEFTLTENDLAYWNTDMVKRAEAGEFQVWVAPDSQSGKAAEFWYE